MRVDRRRFLRLAGLHLVGLGCSRRASPIAEGQVMTVRGPAPASSLGFTLSHEHLFSTFGLDPVARPRYDRGAVLAAVSPHLRRARELGCRAIVDCSGAYFGRDPALLRALSDASDLALLTNTGYYGAANDRYVPEHAYRESAADLARRWTREWREGIDGTGIRPGFLKIGVDPGPLSAIDRKLVEAAALAHLATGLTIAVHTGDNPAGVRDQLEILAAARVHPSAWIWVHAHNAEDPAALLDAARRGAWISLDGYRADRSAVFVERLELLRRGGHLEQVLLSHDGNTYPRNGADPPRPFTDLMTHLLPALRDAGFSAVEIAQLMERNPGRAYAVNVRSA